MLIHFSNSCSTTSDSYVAYKEASSTLETFSEIANPAMLIGRLTKLEDNQHILIDKMTVIESLLTKLSDSNTNSGSLNKNIENELLEKMSKMNSNQMNNKQINSNYRIELKPNELTFENIIENNYTFQDIHMSLDASLDTPHINNIELLEQSIPLNETLNSLLF